MGLSSLALIPVQQDIPRAGPRGHDPGCGVKAVARVAGHADDLGLFKGVGRE